MWSLQGSVEWSDGLTAIYFRSCYDDIISTIKNKKLRNVLVLGTPGIGKSTFLPVLLVHLVEKARTENTQIPLIHFWRKEGGEVKKYRLLENGSVQHASDATPDYLLSDSVDIGDRKSSKILSIEVASDKEANYNVFNKKMQNPSTKSKRIVMPLFTLEELKKIKPMREVTVNRRSVWTVISDAEMEFRHNVFGGSARNCVSIDDDVPMSRKSGKVAEEVEKNLLWYFGQSTIDKFWNSWENIKTILVSKLKSESIERPSVVNSTFIHRVAYTECVWASNFMKILAGSVKDMIETSILNEIQALIGGSGLGIAFESVGHKKLTSATVLYQLIALNAPNKRKGRTEDSSIITSLPVCLFSDVADIRNLEDNVYGLPTVGNFPLIDAVIQPSTFINYIISTSHEGAIDRLDDLLLQLRKPEDAKFIFVTRKENVNEFKYNNKLSEIKQYVTADDPMVLPTEISKTTKKRSNTKRKRNSVVRIVAQGKKSRVLFKWQYFDTFYNSIP